MSLSCDLNRKITKYFFALLLRKTYAIVISGVTPVTFKTWLGAVRRTALRGPRSARKTRSEKKEGGPFGPPYFSLDPIL